MSAFLQSQERGIILKQEYTKLVADILKQMNKVDHVQLADIPNIELYMDQVTHFMEENLTHTRRHEDDKILTKTMINNYAKNKLLPAPVKKRYSREHMLVLLFIYYLKAFLPLNDIQAILTPITDRFFDTDSDFGIEDIYQEIYALEKNRIPTTSKDIMESFHSAANSFTDCPEEDQEFLQIFSFICLLSFDIYEKKQVIEKMIDLLPALQEKSSEKISVKDKKSKKE